MKKMLKVLSLTVPSNSTTFKLEVTHVIPDADGNITKGWGRQTPANPVDKTKELDINSIKTIYFAPKVNVPRERVRPFLEEKGIKIIRDADKADAVIVSDDTYDYNVTNLWGNACGAASMLHFLRIFNGALNTNEIIIQLEAYVNSGVLDYNYVIYDINQLNSVYRYSPNCVKSNASWGAHYTSPGQSDFGGDAQAVDRGYISQVKDHTIYDPTYVSRCYDQTAILKHLGENIIDKESYESIRTMFQSTDKSNHLIAMTIMANANYEQSFMYLAFLLEEFGRGPIYNHSYRNTVGFKSLTKWMGYNKYRFDKDAILDISLEKKLLTRELLAIVKDYYLQGANAYSSNFEVSEIKLNAESQKKIDKYFNEKENGNRLPSGGELLQEEVSL
jgi:hypothetical protein